MKAGPLRGVVRLSRHFVMALVVVIVISLVALLIEHSALSQSVAPHSSASEHSELVLRDGQPYIRVDVNAAGRSTVTYRRAAVPKRDVHGGVVRIKQGGSPADLSRWNAVLEIIVLIVVIALLVAVIDRLRRRVRRRRHLPMASASR